MSIIGDKFLEGISLLRNSSYTQSAINKILECNFLNYMNPIVVYSVHIFDTPGGYGGTSPVTITLYNGTNRTGLLSYGNKTSGQPMDITGGFPYRTETTSSNLPSLQPYSISGYDIDGTFEYIEPVYPITYRLTNCTASTAPTEAMIGDTVTVPFQFTSGYGFVNPSSDVYVTNNGVVIPSQYSNGVLTFTMPDPT